MSEYPALHMIIDGEKVSGGGRRTFDVVNPVTGEPIGALPLAETADLDRALDVAAKGFRIWRKSTPQERAAVLQGAARLMVERQESASASTAASWCGLKACVPPSATSRSARSPPSHRGTFRSAIPAASSARRSPRDAR